MPTQFLCDNDPISCCARSRGATQQRAPLLILTDTLTFPNGIHSLRRFSLKNMRVDDLFGIPSLANIVALLLYGFPKLCSMNDWASHTRISGSINYHVRIFEISLMTRHMQWSRKLASISFGQSPNQWYQTSACWLVDRKFDRGWPNDLLNTDVGLFTLIRPNKRSA